MTYQVKIPLFEGPFDLLIFFIRRDELDIYDIPISKITSDFFEYIHQLEKMDIEVSSEFILMAATLMNIKSKMLLPRPEMDEEGNEIDPRDELVRHLLEYKKYKSGLETFERWEEKMIQREKRGNTKRELESIGNLYDVDIELQDLDLYRLLKVYRNILEKQKRRKEVPRHQVKPYPYTIQEQKTWILSEVQEKGQLGFDQVMALQPDKIALIFNFLAILELLSERKLLLVLGEGFNNFWVKSLDSMDG